MDGGLKMGKRLSPEEDAAYAALASAARRVLELQTHKRLVRRVRALARSLGIDLLDGRRPEAVTIEELRAVIEWARAQ